MRVPGTAMVQFTVRLLEALDLTAGAASDVQLVQRAVLDAPGGALGLVMAPRSSAILGRSAVTVNGAAGTVIDEVGSVMLRDARARLPAGALPARTEEERDIWRSGRTGITTITYDYRSVREVVLAHLPELEAVLDEGDPIYGADNDVYALLGGPAWADFARAVRDGDLDRVRRHAVLLHELLHHGDLDVENAAEIEYVMQINNDRPAQAALVEVGYEHLVSALPGWTREIRRQHDRGEKRSWWPWSTSRR